MKDLLTEIYKNKKFFKKNTQKLFDVFVYNIYLYNSYYEINETLNLLHKEYGTEDRCKFKNLKNNEIVRDYLYSRLIYIPYSQNQADATKIKKRKIEIENKIKKSNYDTSDDKYEIIKLEKDLEETNDPISYYIKQYIETYEKLQNNEYAQEDFCAQFFKEDKEIEGKYSEAIYKLCLESIVDKRKCKASTFKESFEKHEKYIRLYLYYLKLTKQLNIIENVKESDYQLFIKKNFDKIRESYYSILSDDAISLLAWYLENEEYEIQMNLFLIPYIQYFNEYEDKNEPYGQAIRKSTYLFRDKKSSTSLSKLKDNIEKKKNLLDFNFLNEMVYIKKRI